MLILLLLHYHHYHHIQNLDSKNQLRDLVSLAFVSTLQSKAEKEGEAEGETEGKGEGKGDRERQRERERERESESESMHLAEVEYQHSQAGPSHAPVFTCRCCIGGVLQSTATGSSKKRAEKCAAALAYPMLCNMLQSAYAVYVCLCRCLRQYLCLCVYLYICVLLSCTLTLTPHSLTHPLPSTTTTIGTSLLTPSSLMWKVPVQVQRGPYISDICA